MTTATCPVARMMTMTIFRSSDDGWTGLQFYAFVVRKLGVPASFERDDEGWTAKGPFTKASQSVLDGLVAQGV